MRIWDADVPSRVPALPRSIRILLHGLLLAGLPLLPCALHATPQSAGSDVEGAWQADVEENQRLDEEAQAQARRTAPAATTHPEGDRHGPPPDGGRGGRSGGPGGGGGGPGGSGPGGGGPGGGGPGGPPGGDGPSGGPRGPGGPGGPGSDADTAPLARLLRPEFEFAAPLARSLLIQRTRQTAIFANHDGSRQTLVPIDGTPAELEGGIRAVARETGGVLTLRLETLDGFHADYRYIADPATPNALRVEISALNPGDPEPYRVQRVYRQGQGG